MLADHQGSIRQIVDNTGSLLNQITYDSYGNITNQTNPSVTFRFGYTGREWDGETGQYYYRARYYDARVGRFLSTDPIGFTAGDANLYRYVGNSPTNATDPSGLLTIIIPGGFGQLGRLPQNIERVARYPVLSIGNLGLGGFSISRQLEGLKEQVTARLSQGLLLGEPIVIIAHSDGNRLVGPLVDFIRGLDGIPLRDRSGKVIGCVKTKKRRKDEPGLTIEVGRLDPTGVPKQTVRGADKIIDVGSNIPKANPITQPREWLSNRILKPDFRAPIGTTHDGLLNERSVILILDSPLYNFKFWGFWMPNLGNLIFDSFVAALLLGLVVGFHLITQNLFITVFDIYRYPLILLSEFVNTPGLILLYLIPIVIHMIISGLCVAARFSTNTNFGFIDVLIITLFPIFLYEFCGKIEQKLVIFHKSTKDPATELQIEIQSIQSYSAETLINFLMYCIFNAGIFFIGGYISWLLMKSLAK
jgi:RHS repeat-associated protein